MKIGVEAGCLGVTDKRLQVGVFQVVKNLLIQLGKLDKKNEYILYSFIPIDKKLLKLFGPHMKNVVVASSKGWLTIWLPLQLLKDKPDVFLALNQALPLKLPMQAYKILGLFYDIAFERFPNLYAYGANVKKHKFQSRILANNADKIIAISHTTKNDLHDIYNISQKKITVAYPGLSKLQTTKKLPIKTPYFLFVGAFKKSKNLPLLLEAFDMFLQKSNKTYDLLLVGGDRWLDPDVVEGMKTISLKAKKHIHNLGYVDDRRLGNLYKNAVAFVSPSLYEGFGLPFIEAQSVNCPVIASTRGSLPEILGDSAILVEPSDAEGLANAMLRITKDKNLRGRIVRKGKINVKKYSWKDFAKKIQSAIDHL